MASLGNEVIIRKELRPCIAKGEKALFHEWAHISRIREAMLRGQVSGVTSETFGIVEFENGNVEYVYPNDITFLDNKLSEFSFDLRRN